MQAFTSTPPHALRQHLPDTLLAMVDASTGGLRELVGEYATRIKIAEDLGG
jgi:hypothetical protein